MSVSKNSYIQHPPIIHKFYQQDQRNNSYDTSLAKRYCFTSHTALHCSKDSTTQRSRCSGGGQRKCSPKSFPFLPLEFSGLLKQCEGVLELFFKIFFFNFYQINCYFLCLNPTSRTEEKEKQIACFNWKMTHYCPGRRVNCHSRDHPAKQLT